MTKRKSRRPTRQSNQPAMDAIDEPSSPPRPSKTTQEDDSMSENPTLESQQSENVQESETLGGKQERDEDEGMVVSPSPSHSNQFVEMSDDQDSSYVPPVPAASVGFDLESPVPVVFKRDPSQALNKKQQASLINKFEELRDNLCIIPFVPAKRLDFDKHEEVLRKLQLWDFVHVQFDKEVNLELLASLIVNYDRSARSSNVNSYMVMVNRADLAKAVKLPWKKVTQSDEIDVGVLSAESISFLEEFVSNWILLHEDMWQVEDEVMAWTRLIKEGKPQKVDWAAMIWFMVEKELAKGAKLRTCYYASHLQCLMKAQRGELFKEEKRVERKVEREVSVDIKMKNVEEVQVNDLENEKDTELTLGKERNGSKPQQVRDEEDVMDIEEEKGKAPAHPSEWPLDGKKKMIGLSLRPCSSNKPEKFVEPCEVNDVDDDNDEVDEEEVQEEEEEETHPQAVFTKLTRMSSDHFLGLEQTAKIQDSLDELSETLGGLKLEGNKNQSCFRAGTSFAGVEEEFDPLSSPGILPRLSTESEDFIRNELKRKEILPRLSTQAEDFILDELKKKEDSVRNPPPQQSYLPRSWVPPLQQPVQRPSAYPGEPQATNVVNSSRAIEPAKSLDQELTGSSSGSKRVTKSKKPNVGK